jgi:lysozyme
VGEDQFRRSTLLRLLNLKQYIEAGKQLLLWKYDNGKVIQGLINRRIKELAMYNS